MSKRRARESDRERAELLVRCYYRNERLDPNDLEPVDGDKLARELAVFATLGTFELPGGVFKESPDFIRRLFDASRARHSAAGARNPATRAKAEVAEMLELSEDTIHSALHRGGKSRKA